MGAHTVARRLAGVLNDACEDQVFINEPGRSTEEFAVVDVRTHLTITVRMDPDGRWVVD